MKVKYFKTPMWGDCYVADDNYMKIISISNKNLFVMADDERIFGGAYKEINVSKKNFEKMKDLAVNNKRKELTDILKKIHEKNRDILNISKDPFVKIKGDDFLTRNEKLEKSSYFTNYFFKTKSILN